MKKIYFLMIIYIVSMVSCRTVNEIFVENSFDDKKNADYKFYYSLPATQLKVIVIQKTTHFYSGRLSVYSEKYFGKRAEYNTNNTVFSIANVQLEEKAVFDSSRLYSVSYDGDIPLNISLDENGFIAGLNLTTPISLLNCKLANEKYNQTVGKPIDKPIPLPKKYFELNTKAEQAAFLAKAIYTLREDRHYLAIGEATNTYLPDGLATREMLNYLQKLEDSYLREFYGYSYEKWDTFVFNYLPKNTNYQRVMLFRFSESSGISSLTNSNAYPVYLDIQASNLKNVSNLEDISKVVRLKNNKLEGLAYSVPNLCQVTIHDEIETLYSTSLIINQLGRVAFLPNSYFHQNVKVRYFPCKGTLKEVSAPSDF